jgi:hypothetical protein
MDKPLIVRPALSADLPQLLALYPHLDPADRIPPLDVAERRLKELQGYRGSAILIGIAEGTIVASCTLIVVSQPDARWPALRADRECRHARGVSRTRIWQATAAGGGGRGVAG